MRILQLIDSQEAGGAERMAVNYANALADRIAFSGLVVSRKEGPLLPQVDPKVSYLFLNKKSPLDLKAVFRLRKFVKAHKVEIVQAHSTSFFTAFLLKIVCPGIQLIWHDHYGDSAFLSQRPLLVFRICLPFFNGIISVNQELKDWASQKLKSKTVIYLPNFPTTEKCLSNPIILKGENGKRILCLANLRAQKNHMMLLEIAQRLLKSHPDWSLHLVGKDFEDAYSLQIKDRILALQLEKNVFLYGSKQEVNAILEQSAIAILTSQSEGMPMALLEYGRKRKAVVVTSVGEIPALIQNGRNGFLVPSQDKDQFYESLVRLIEDESLRADFGNALYQTVLQQYAEETVLKNYLNWVKTI